MARSKDGNQELIYRVLRERPEGLRFTDLYKELKGKMAKATLANTLKELEKKGKITRIIKRGERDVRYILSDKEDLIPAFLALEIYTEAVKAEMRNYEKEKECDLPPLIFADSVILSSARVYFSYFKDEPRKAYKLWRFLFDILYAESQSIDLEDIGIDPLKIEKIVADLKEKEISDFLNLLEKKRRELREITMKK